MPAEAVPQSSPRRRPWVNATIIVAILVLPVLAFVALQVWAAYTRSGTIDEVWFADTPEGPRIIGRDQIVTGMQEQPTLRDRLVLVDASNGKRLARERVDGPRRFLRAGPEGLWFCEKHGCQTFEARDANTLEKKNVVAPGWVAPAEATARDPLASSAELGGKRIDATIADGGVQSLGNMQSAAFLRDDVSGQPIVLDQNAALVVHRPPEDPKNTLLVTRVGADLHPAWTAKLERQRAIRAAHVVGDTVVIVTSGAARDFAIAVDLATGKTRWVAYF